MDAARERKKAFRKAVAEVFALIPPDARRECDATLAERLRELPAIQSAKMVMGFAAMPDEPDLSAFYRRWLAGGGHLALPVWLGGDRMLVREVKDIDRQLVSGRGGIMEPAEGLPMVEPERLDAVIVPGRAFSEGLDRLGRGAGCYDVLLGSLRACTIGVAYDFQVFPAIPVGVGDVSMDMVTTPGRLLKAENV